MTNEEIIQNNKLIAEFMGATVTLAYSEMPEMNQDGLIFYYQDKSSPSLYRNMSSAEIKYHYSWSWLMPVVEKIEQGNYGFKMCRKVVEIYYDDTKEVILKVKESSRFESLYKAVIDFINWYNTNLKP